MKVKYNGKILKLFEQVINEHTYEKVFIKDSITIIPFNEKDEIILIKEKRVHETPSVRWKFVTGFLEPDQNIKDNANRELQEEIGKKSLSLEKYYTIKATGTINTNQHFFIAKNLIDSKLPNPDTDIVLETQTFPVEKVIEGTLNNRLIQAGASAYILLKWFIENESIKINS